MRVQGLSFFFDVDFVPLLLLVLRDIFSTKNKEIDLQNVPVFVIRYQRVLIPQHSNIYPPQRH